MKRFAACWTLVALVSCAPPGDDYEPRVEYDDGLEVAVVPTLPDPLDPAFAWELEVVREVATVDRSGTPVLYDPWRLLPLRDGRLLVVDTGPGVFVIVDPERPERSIRFGSVGAGPGEVGRGLALGELADGSLAATDRSNRRMHLFTPAGDWIESHALGIQSHTDAAQLPGRDRFVAAEFSRTEGRWGQRLVGLDAGSGAVDPLVELPAPPAEAEAGRIQTGRYLWAVSGESILTMWSAAPRVMVHAHDGTPRRRIELPFTRRTLSETDIARQVALHGGIANTLDVGPAALTNMLYAAGDTVFGLFLSDLWRSAEDPSLPAGRIYWRLFTEGGRYLGVVEIPEGFRYLGGSGETFWARQLDATLTPVLRELRLRPAAR